MSSNKAVVTQKGENPNQKQYKCVDVWVLQVKLVQHTYSCLYGTFLCNNARERESRNIYKRTCSVWSLLRAGNKNFQNFLYIPTHDMVILNDVFNKLFNNNNRRSADLLPTLIE